MFYMTAFLTLLIGLLIYMMDPAPTDLRRDMDINSGEPYIGAFLNQHQAARDFLKHWLGTIDPSTGMEVWDGNNNIQEASSQEPTVKVMALPGGYDGSDRGLTLGQDDFMPLGTPLTASGFVSERATNPASTNTGYLKDYDKLSGSYHSALLCLNNDKTSAQYQQLENCYIYDEQVSVSDPGGGGNHDEIQVKKPEQNPINIIRRRFDDNVQPYVITYGLKEPDWWKEKGTPKALKHQLWRQALSRRAHASAHCGILTLLPQNTKVQKDCSWKDIGGGKQELQCNTIPAVGWTYDAGASIYQRVGLGIDGDGKTHYDYCLDNGQRCVNILYNGIQTFLEEAFENAETRTDDPSKPDLSEMLFCMSPVDDPYEKIISSSYHFDGINFTTLGAQTVIDTAKPVKYWSPVNGSIVSPTVPSPQTIAGSQNFEFFQLPGTNTFSGVKLKSNSGTNQILTMPFDYPNTDFTLNVVLNFSGTNQAGWIVGTDVNTEGQFALEQEISDPNQMWFYPGGMDIVDSTLRTKIALKGFITETRHVFTIMRQDGEMFFLWDGGMVCGSVGNWNASNPSTNQRITFGPISNVQILDVRYYNYAMNGRTLKKLFQVDMERYGVKYFEAVYKEKSSNLSALCIIPDGKLSH